MPDAPDPTSVKSDLSISMVRANLLAIYFILPVMVLAAIYIVFWDFNNTLTILASYKSKANILWIIAAFFAGIVVHELIHAIAWTYLADKKNGQIKFGINWKTLTPYVHCNEPMNITAYRWGAAAPGIILGFIPYLIGLFFGNPVIAIYGLFFCFSASGDALILWILRKVDKGKMVEDHPTNAGCYVIE